MVKGFRGLSLRFKIKGLGLRVQGSEFGVQSSGFSVLRFSVYDLGLRV
jgi:hypothetical protein